MRRHLALLMLVLSLLGWASPARATERLAVLELTGKSLGTEERATLTDTVRGAVVEALGGRVQVMTKENMEVMMSDMGMDATCVSEGACEVETARNLGVDYVVSGSVASMSGTLVVSLKLLETRSGQMMSSKQVTGANALALMQGIPEPAKTLVGALGGPPVAAAPPASAVAGTAPTLKPLEASKRDLTVPFDPAEVQYKEPSYPKCTIEDTKGRLHGGTLTLGDRSWKLSDKVQYAELTDRLNECGDHQLVSLLASHKMIGFFVGLKLTGAAIIMEPFFIYVVVHDAKELSRVLRGEPTRSVATAALPMYTDKSATLKGTYGLASVSSYEWRTGDRVVAVGGVPVKDTAEIAKVLLGVPADAIVTVTVRRGGAVLEGTIRTGAVLTKRPEV